MLMNTSTDWSKHFILTADLDFNEVLLTPIGNYNGTHFTGTLEGNGRTIRNADINIPDNNYVSFFGCIGAGSLVRNLVIKDVSVKGNNRIGGLAGINYGTITTCYVTGTVTGNTQSNSTGGLIGRNYGTINTCRTAVTVIGGSSNSNHAGGLVGYNRGGTIINCSASGTVSGDNCVGGLAGRNSGTITSCFAEGTVNGNTSVGGLVGYNNLETADPNYHWCGTITTCYAIGAVTGNSYVGGLVGQNSDLSAPGSIITACYAAGSVTGTSDVGGLAGYNQGDVNACLWDTGTSGQSTSAGGTGKATTEMIMLSTFTSAGWDFLGETTNGTKDDWRMCVDDLSYPYLNWEYYRFGDFVCPDIVSFEDLAYFAQRWLTTDCGLNNDCDRTDTNIDDIVNFRDFTVLAKNWQYTLSKAVIDSDTELSFNNSNFTKPTVSFKITIDHTKVAEDLINFPVLITGDNLPSEFWSWVAPDGSNILCQLADKTELSYELVSLNRDDKKLELWVKLPICSNSVDTVLGLNCESNGSVPIDSLKFLWFSDSHNQNAGTQYNRYYRQVLTHKIPAMLATAASVGDVNFIIGTGDICEFKYGDGATTLANLAAVQNALSPYPYYFAMGNHDIPYATKPAVLAQLGYNKGYYSFNKGNSHFVSLDANFDINGNDHTGGFIDGRLYYIPQEERDWLAADLASNSDKPTFVFIHQRIDTYYYPGSGAHNTVEAADGNAVRAIFEAAGNVKVVFQGHTHYSSMTTVNGIKYYTIMGMVDGDCAANPNNNAYALIDITNGILTITPYARADNASAWTTKTLTLLANDANSVVWDSNYVMVQHFNQNPTTSGVLADSTLNYNNAMASAAMAAGDLVDDGIGKAWNFGEWAFGANKFAAFDYTQMPNNLNGASAITIEAWLRPNALPFGTTYGYGCAFFQPIKHDAGGWNTGLVFGINNSGQFITAGRAGAGETFRIGTGSALTCNASTLYHLVGIIDFANDKIKLYINGSQNGNDIPASFTSTAYTIGNLSGINAASAAKIGDGYTYYSTNSHLDATISEMRISKSARSAGWIATSYNNQNSPGTFYFVELSSFHPAYSPPPD